MSAPDTSGFYIRVDDRMMCAPNSVTGPDGLSLEKSQKDSYSYPVQGWTWYDSQEQAYQANGLQVPEPPMAVPADPGVPPRPPMPRRGT